MNIQKIPRLVFWFNLSSTSLLILLLHAIKSSVLICWMLFILYSPMLFILYPFQDMFPRGCEWQQLLLIFTIPLNSLFWAWFAEKVLSMKKWSLFKKVFWISFSFVSLLSVMAFIFLFPYLKYQSFLSELILLQYILYFPCILLTFPFTDGMFYIQVDVSSLLVIVPLNSLIWAWTAKRLFGKKEDEMPDIKEKESDKKEIGS